jgi:hypothetical protein
MLHNIPKNKDLIDGVAEAWYHELPLLFSFSRPGTYITP